MWTMTFHQLTIVLASIIHITLSWRVGVQQRGTKIRSDFEYNSNNYRHGTTYAVDRRRSSTGYLQCSITSESDFEVPIVVKPTKHDVYTGRDPQRVRIFDTTLRDGEQSPGCTMNTEEKIAVAKQLAKLGVDIIEAGFPVSSEGDFEAVSKIAQTVGNYPDPPIICGLARAVKNDITTCYEAVKHAKFPRLHVFIATSEIHMEHKLKKTKEEVLQLTTDMVSYGATLFEDIEFSAEDALRSDPEFLFQVYSRAIAAGAKTINVPDTVGYSNPVEFKQLISLLRKNVQGIDDVIISVHGHNDLGMAVANFISAVEAGARQLECTINGIGERAGNAALEELAMVLHVRKAYYNKYFGRPETCVDPLTNINIREIAKSSRLVSSITGMQVQANKAIVGANAFAHESGIHQDGVLKNRRTYEIMDAESIGAAAVDILLSINAIITTTTINAIISSPSATASCMPFSHPSHHHVTGIGLSDNNIVLGKHSGRHAFRSRLTELGYTLSDSELNAAFIRFKELADKKKDISNADIESMVTDEIQMISNKVYKLNHVQVQCGDKQISTATISIFNEETGIETITSKTGTGPVDAVYRAISELTCGEAGQQQMKLLEYTVSSVTAGIDALGEVTVRLQDITSGRTGIGRSANTDVIVASAQAYLNAINRLVELRGIALPKHPQFSTVV